jgi:hypothetical protein
MSDVFKSADWAREAEIKKQDESTLERARRVCIDPPLLAPDAAGILRVIDVMTPMDGETWTQMIARALGAPESILKPRTD